MQLEVGYLKNLQGEGVKMKKFFGKMKDLRISDLIAGLKFLIALVPSFVYKLYLSCKGRRFWLICEEPMEAQDNGWCFFKYMNQNHPEIETIYAIKRKAVMYKRISAVGRVTEYGSIKHWIYYLCAEVNISSQKGGKPNAAICYVLEVYGLLKNRRVFLQHGITMNDCEYLYYKNTKFWLFITSAAAECKYIKEKFGYPSNTVVCTGFSRFDYLKNNLQSKIILLMPSWRYWLKLPSKVDKEMNEEYLDFESSEYYRIFQSLITDNRLLGLLEKYNYQLFFYPHRNIQMHIHSFWSNSNKVKIISSGEYEIQKLFEISKIMITDYSSVSFDFAYLKKAVIYYQFDIERFRKYQYKEGYFCYERNGFGPVCYDYDSLLDVLEKTMRNKLEEKYYTRSKDFFAYDDKNNSERVYYAIMQKLKEENVG